MAEIEASRELSRTEVATYLREFATQLESTKQTARSNRNESAARENRDTQDQVRGETATDATEQRNPIEGTNQRTPTDEANRRTSNETDREGAASDSGSISKHGKVTFVVGNDSATINPPENLTFDVAVDSDSAMMSAATHRSVNFHLEWDVTDVDEDDELSIE